MINRNASRWQGQNWQDALKNCIKDYQTLIERLELTPQQLDTLPADTLAAMKQFPLKVTESFLARIEKGNIDDPLLLQILPTSNEMRDVSGFNKDPLQEANFVSDKGILHKYRSRVLLISTSACAINCRYCFRRHFPYQEQRASLDEWRTNLAPLQFQPEINEVILSGGDPLVLNNQHLRVLIQMIEAVPHITRLRFHSRIPIVLPNRMDKELLEILSQSRLNCIIVTHSNHANEINQEVKDALAPYALAGICLLNQAVLLRHINDSLNALENLSEALFNARIMPYYLHLLDPVAGAAHFNVDETTAIQLMNQLKTRLPGFLMPRLAKETPGETSKTTLAY